MLKIIAAVGSLFALYIKFRLVAFAVKIAMFTAIYFLFKNTLQWTIDLITVKLELLSFPCMISYILNGLDIMTMINFGLSFYATVYISRFLLSLMTKIAI